jgi:hypothetical protein
MEDLEGDSCLLATQSKEGHLRDFKTMTLEQLPDLGLPSEVVNFEALFGIYELLSGTYVALVLESEPYVDTEAIKLRRAQKIELHPLFNRDVELSETKQKEQNTYLDLLRLAFDEHDFFFHPTCEVTHTQQRLALLSENSKRIAINVSAADTSNGKGSTLGSQASASTRSVRSASGSGKPAIPQPEDPLLLVAREKWVQADHRFFWNLDTIVDLLNCPNAGTNGWVVPFMSAFVDYRPDVPCAGEKVSVLLISRRSRYHQGCRFTRRGLDDNGHCANFVETEQITVRADGSVSAFVQVRGSIPLHWSSPVSMRYAPSVIVDNNLPRTLKSARRHVCDMGDFYAGKNGCSEVLFINLVDSKGEQGMLAKGFEEVVNQLKPASRCPLTYVGFDFHKECKKKGKWDNLARLVEQTESNFQSIGHFGRAKDGTVLRYQSGVIRTNCMDNLDRTNVVQSLYARRSMLRQLDCGGVDEVKEVVGASLKIKAATLLSTGWPAFEKIYKAMWVGNANALSQLYAGSGALKVDFTKTGKRTFKGMFDDGVNSCWRYYVNNFTDGYKQDAISLMLGNYKVKPGMPSPLRKRKSKDSVASAVLKIFTFMVLLFSFLNVCSVGSGLGPGAGLRSTDLCGVLKSEWLTKPTDIAIDAASGIRFFSLFSAVQSSLFGCVISVAIFAICHFLFKNIFIDHCMIHVIYFVFSRLFSR